MPSDQSLFGRKEEQTAEPSMYVSRFLVLGLRKCGVGDQVLGRRRTLVRPPSLSNELDMVITASAFDICHAWGV